MEPSAQAVLAGAGIGLTVIVGALLAIARHDRRQAGGRTTARTIAGAMAALPPAQSPASHAPASQLSGPQAPELGAIVVPDAMPRSRRLRLGRRAGT